MCARVWFQLTHTARGPLVVWSSSLQSLTLDGDRINPSSVAALAGASHLTRLALLHSPYLKYASLLSSPLLTAQSLLCGFAR
jgi:hypothetical protein